jgi:nicotinate phosphoribosyltransferase
VKILVSGGLDEHDIAALLAADAPIDGFGIGTRLTTSADAPSVDLVYKLVRFDGRDVLKLSDGKRTWVGSKQVVRRLGPDGRLAGDTLALAEEPLPPATAGLLETVMRGGELTRPHPTLAEIRMRCAAQLAMLPEGLRRLTDPEAYVPVPSEKLRGRQREAERRVAESGG